MKLLKSLFIVGLVCVTSTSLLAAGKSKASNAKASKSKPVPQAVAAKAAKPGPLSIAQIVIALSKGDQDGEFDVLLEAVKAAGLVGALDGSRQLTVFAPTDAAFVKTLGVEDEAEAITTVQGLPVDVLTDILLFHVIPGRRTSTSVLAAPQYETLGGAYLTRSELFVAGIATTDISARNGVIHVINSVLIPD